MNAEVIALTLTFPLPSSAELVTVRLPGKLTESQWFYFIDLLAAMREGISVREVARPATSDPVDPTSTEGLKAGQ